MLHKLLTFEEAKRAIEANFKPMFLGEEEAVLLEAYNRVLTEDVISPFDLPSFTSSTVNGFAVKAEDTKEANEEVPTIFKLGGVASVGEQPKAPLAKNEAFGVSAGVVLPEGADAVVVGEDVEIEDETLKVYDSVSAGENVRKQGSDIKKGDVVLNKGRVLGSSEIGILAALGFKQVKVQKFPIVAVISIGDEVNELGKPLSPGKVFDINAYTLCTAVIECGAKPVYFGAVPDDKERIERILRMATTSADIVIASSSVDVAEIADLLGKPGIVVNGVAVRPGKNTAVVFANDKPVFLLPNSPSAALLMFQLFARSLVKRLGGRPFSGLKAVRAYAGSKMFSAKGSRTFTLVKLAFDKQCNFIADSFDASGEVSALVGADGFVEIEENKQFLEVGQEVIVYLLRGSAGKF